METKDALRCCNLTLINLHNPRESFGVGGEGGIFEYLATPIFHGRGRAQRHKINMLHERRGGTEKWNGSRVRSVGFIQRDALYRHDGFILSGKQDISQYHWVWILSWLVCVGVGSQIN